MNLYTVITADKSETPVLSDVLADEVAAYLGITRNNVGLLVHNKKERNGYRIIVSKRNIRSDPEWKERYKAAHSRNEYYREYYRRSKYVKARRNIERIQAQQ